MNRESAVSPKKCQEATVKQASPENAAVWAKDATDMERSARSGPVNSQVARLQFSDSTSRGSRSAQTLLQLPHRPR